MATPVPNKHVFLHLEKKRFVGKGSSAVFQQLPYFLHTSLGWLTFTAASGDPSRKLGMLVPVWEKHKYVTQDRQDTDSVTVVGTDL